VKALGKHLNYRHVADGGWVRLDNATNIAFFCYLAGAVGDTYTLQEAKDAAGTGAQNLAALGDYYTSTGDGSDAWVKQAHAAAATVVTAAAAAQNAMCVEVGANQLSSLYKYVKLTSTGAGLVTAVQTDLTVQRDPANLAKLS